jgi:chorismate synthase
MLMVRFTTSGESHGRALVAIVEGIPAGLKVNQEYINEELSRRQQGYGRGKRMLIEQDKA